MNTQKPVAGWRSRAGCRFGPRRAPGRESAATSVTQHTGHRSGRRLRDDPGRDPAGKRQIAREHRAVLPDAADQGDRAANGFWPALTSVDSQDPT